MQRVLPAAQYRWRKYQLSHLEVSIIEVRGTRNCSCVEAFNTFQLRQSNFAEVTRQKGNVDQSTMKSIDAAVEKCMAWVMEQMLSFCSDIIHSSFWEALSVVQRFSSSDYGTRFTMPENYRPILGDWWFQTSCIFSALLPFVSAGSRWSPVYPLSGREGDFLHERELLIVEAQNAIN